MDRVLYIVGGTSHILKGYSPPDDFARVVYCGRDDVIRDGSEFVRYDLSDISSNNRLLQHVASHSSDVSFIYAAYVAEGLSSSSQPEEVLDSFTCNCFMPIDLFSRMSKSFSERKLTGLFISSIYAHVSPKRYNYRNTESQNPLYYGVFKAGVEQAIRWLSTQERHHRFNSVVLGPMPSEEAMQADPGLIKNLLKSMPSGGMVEQHELAQIINLLIRDELVSLRGVSLVLDGGYLLW